MSKIIKHAKNEMNLAWDKKNRYNKTLRKKTLSLLRTLSKQRNSSFLEEIVIGLFTKLARHRVLTPLTGKKKEWKGESKYKGIGHMHINKPTSNRFIAQCKELYKHSYSWSGEERMTQADALIDLAKEFADPRWKMGRIIMVADFYAPETMVKIERPQSF